jgi:hypothetical protein
MPAAIRELDGTLITIIGAIFIDGKLICARQLINGTTIWQENGGDARPYELGVGRAN